MVYNIHTTTNFEVARAKGKMYIVQAVFHSYLSTGMVGYFNIVLSQRKIKVSLTSRTKAEQQNFLQICIFYTLHYYISLPSWVK
jgi:hypothetical protein